MASRSAKLNGSAFASGTVRLRASASNCTAMPALVTSGPLRVRVPLAQIQRITPTRSVRSAPTLSLDRLEITYGKGQVVIISPKDHAAFFAAVAARAPQAQLPAGT